MRKPRDLDGELQALADRAKSLKVRRSVQLGELVIACGAGRLDIETLAGALLAAAEAQDPLTLAQWERRGRAFFHSGGSLEPKSGLAPDGAASGQDAGFDAQGRSGQGADRA